jgi:hypothetical protein
MNGNNDETDEIRTNEEGVETSSNESVDDLIKLIQEVIEVVGLYRGKLQKELDITFAKLIVWSFNFHDDVWDPDDVLGCDWFISDDDDCQFNDSFKEELV